jgi:hypothetical protein
LRVLLRPTRGFARLVGLGLFAAAAVLAASPAGQWFVGLWRAIDPGLVGEAGFLVILAGFWAIRRTLRRPVPVRSKPLVWASMLITPIVFVVRYWLVPVVLAALLHSAPDVLLAALPILAAVALVNATGAYLLGLASMAMQELQRMARFPVQYQHTLLGGWVHDQFLARRSRPNFGRVERLIAYAQQTGDHAYLPPAAHALDLIEREVLPRYTDESPIHQVFAAHREQYLMALDG